MSDAADAAAAAVVVVARAAEPEGHARDEHDGRGEGGRHRADQDIAVQHVAQLVRHHAFDFADRSSDLQNARGEGDRSVLRIAAGGEGVGRLLGMIQYSFGIGRPMRWVRSAHDGRHAAVDIRVFRFGHRLRVVRSPARSYRRRSNSEKFITTAMPRPMYRPWRPAMASPPKSRIAAEQAEQEDGLDRVGRWSFELLPHSTADHEKRWSAQAAPQWRSALAPPRGTSFCEAKLVRRGIGVHFYGIAFLEIAVEQLERQRILNQPLDGAPHGPGAVLRIVAFVDDAVLGRRRDFQRRSSAPSAAAPRCATGYR